MRNTMFMVMACAAGVAAMPVVGFVEDFDVDTGGFDFMRGASVTRELGGVGGASDGYLNVGTSFPDQLAARAIGAAPYTGDWSSAGITAVSFWLLDSGATDDDVTVRVGIGDRRVNFWISNAGFTPTGEWTRHSVGLTDASSWTQVIGTDGDFGAALRSTDVLQFRAAAEPAGRAPDVVEGDFGVDRIALIPAASVSLTLAGGVLIASRRRR